MSIRELYEWAVENGVEDYDLMAQHSDDGGDYPGHRYTFMSNICIDRKEREVIV